MPRRKRNKDYITLKKKHLDKMFQDMNFIKMFY